jgi:iron complex transport system substrate-binding protein
MNDFSLRVITVFTVLLAVSFIRPVVIPAGTVTDQIGRSLVVPDEPVRVVSLAPSITEIVYGLGQGKRLVGATQYSTYPPEAAFLPRIGSYVHPDIEKIAALEPDLCLATKDGNPKYIVDKITSLGIPVYVINPRELSQIVDVITRLGSLLHGEEAAAELVLEMEKRIHFIQAKIEIAESRPRVFFQIDANPLFSAGSNTFIDELIKLAGGINTAAGANPYPRYSWEDILILQPEIVIISSMAGGQTPDELISSWKKWDQLSAVKNGKIFVVEADLFDRPTPRLIEGLETIARIIHPEVFED